MKRLFSLAKQHWLFIFLLFFTFFAIFWPVFIKRQVPMSANLLASFFNPYAAEKFVGWEQGIPNKPTGIDDVRIFYPQRHFTIQSVLSGQLPLWNPYNNSGNYLIGLSETAVFYPLFFILFFVPQLYGWIFLILIEPLLAGLGMYLYLQLFTNKKSSAFGAVVFAFSGIVIVRTVEGLSVGHTLLWLPLAFYAVAAFAKNKRLKYLFILLIALSLPILAGWFQFAFYIFLFSFIYALCTINSRKSLLIFLPFVFTPLVTLFHIIPSIESLATSPRGLSSIAQILQLHLMPVTHIFTFIFSDLWGNPGAYTFFGKSEYKESILYIGTIPFVVSLFSFAKLKNKTVLFFILSGITSLFLGLDTQFTNKILSVPIPIVSTFLPNRIFLITTFSFTVLSAFGLQELQKGVSKKNIMFVSILILCELISVNGYIFVSNGFPFLAKYHFLDSVKHIFLFLKNLQLVENERHLLVLARIVVLPDILIGVFALTFFVFLLIKKQQVLFLVILLLTIVGQVYFANRYIPFSNAAFMYPNNAVFTYLQHTAGENRFISTQEGYISSNIPLFYNLYSPDGVGSMYIARYGEFVRYMQSKGQSYKDIPRIETRIDPSADEVFTNKNQYLLRFMQLDGIKYIFTLKKNSVTPQNDFSLVWQNSIWQIYRYNNVLPRVFWTNKYTVEQNNRLILEKVYSAKDPKEMVLEENPQIKISQNGFGNAKILQYSPNTIKIQTTASANGLIFLSDTYTPNFSVFIDSKPAKLLRADYAFRAVAVPAGNHIVQLQYRDIKENIAFFVAGLSFTSFFIACFILHRKKIIA